MAQPVPVHRAHSPAEFAPPHSPVIGPAGFGDPVQVRAQQTSEIRRAARAAAHLSTFVDPETGEFLPSLVTPVSGPGSAASHWSSRSSLVDSANITPVSSRNSTYSLNSGAWPAAVSPLDLGPEPSAPPAPPRHEPAFASALPQGPAGRHRADLHENPSMPAEHGEVGQHRPPSPAPALRSVSLGVPAFDDSAPPRWAAHEFAPGFVFAATAASFEADAGENAFEYDFQNLNDIDPVFLAQQAEAMSLYSRGRGGGASSRH